MALPFPALPFFALRRLPFLVRFALRPRGLFDLASCCWMRSASRAYGDAFNVAMALLTGAADLTLRLRPPGDTDLDGLRCRERADLARLLSALSCSRLDVSSGSRDTNRYVDGLPGDCDPRWLDLDGDVELRLLDDAGRAAELGRDLLLPLPSTTRDRRRSPRLAPDLGRPAGGGRGCPAVLLALALPDGERGERCERGDLEDDDDGMMSLLGSV